MTQLPLRAPPEGILDFNLTLNFAPQMRKEYLDFLYTTREMALKQIFAIEWGIVAGASFLIGVLLATCIVLLARRRAAGHGTSTAILAPVLACIAFFATCGTVSAQPRDPRPPIDREPMVDLTTLGYVKKNVASVVNNAGCCVFASQGASFTSQYWEPGPRYMNWIARNLPGGGYPSRVTEYMEAFCRAENVQVPDYTQVVGEESINAIREALEDGRSPAVTYSGDPTFYGGPVAHMVNCVYLDDVNAAVVDNNRPESVEWMNRETFVQRHKTFDRGWAVIYHGKPQLCRPTNLGTPRPFEPRDPHRDRFSLKLDPRDESGIIEYGQGCPTCPGGSRYVPQTPSYSPRIALQDERYGGSYTWEPMTDGSRRLKDSAGCIVGEERGGVYYVYTRDSYGRETLTPAICPVGRSRYAGEKITGVDYAHVPMPERGRTMYGSAVSDLRYDNAGRRLFEQRMAGDRARPKIIINLDGAEDVVRDILRRLEALERVFIYAREAYDVIRRFGYGPGITVVSGTSRGVAQEVAYFESVPSDDQLRDALIKADPSYRPGSSGMGSGALDAMAGALLAICVILGVAAGILAFKHRNSNTGGE